MHKALALVLDLVLVLVFATVGRASHSEGLTVSGIASTAWPFALAVLIGWAIMLLRGRNPLSIASGIYLWVVVAFGGMLVRTMSGGGTAVAFIIVTALVVGLLLIGWRLIARLVDRRRGTSLTFEPRAATGTTQA